MVPWSNRKSQAEVNQVAFREVLMSSRNTYNPPPVASPTQPGSTHAQRPPLASTTTFENGVARGNVWSVLLLLDLWPFHAGKCGSERDSVADFLFKWNLQVTHHGSSPKTRAISAPTPKAVSSPVLQRKVLSQLRSGGRTPQSLAKKLEANLVAGTPSSPIIGRRKALAPRVEQQDKENKNVLREKNAVQNPLSSPLREKNNIMHSSTVGKKSNAETQRPAKRKLEGSEVNVDKENVTEAPVRKSTRGKKIQESHLEKPEKKDSKSKEQNMAEGKKITTKRRGKKEMEKDSSPNSATEGAADQIPEPDNKIVDSEPSSRRSARMRVTQEKSSEKESVSKVDKENKGKTRGPRSTGKTTKSVVEETVHESKKEIVTQVKRSRKAKADENSDAKNASPSTSEESVNKPGSKTVTKGTDTAVKKGKLKQNIDESRAQEDKVSPVNKRANGRKLQPRKNVSSPAVKGKKILSETPAQSKKITRVMKKPLGTPGSSPAVKAAESPNESLISSKPKLPIWNTARKKIKTPAERKRRSLRIGGDVFEFTFNADEEGVKKKSRTKRTRRTKREKPKPRTKPTLLTTDPSWQTSILAPKARRPVGEESTRMSGKESTREDGNENTRGGENGKARGNESERTNVAVEYDYDDYFDTHDTEDVFEGFEGETASSFVPGPEGSLATMPMVSASTLPTPAISKHMSKYLGGSSTPRVENMVSLTINEPLPPKEVKEDIAVCFGFDDESEVEESGLNLSPVQRTGQNSQLQITNMTDSFTSYCQPPNQSFVMPSRFSWSRLRPGAKSYSSINCSASMIAHGRSTSTMSVSQMSNVSQNSRSRVGKSSNRSKSVVKKPTETSISRPKRQVNTKRKEDNKQETVGNVSLLFEEEEGTERQLTLDEMLLNQAPQKEQLSSSGQENVRQLGNSPEKSFSKPARKSYDRGVLEEIRKKFIKEYGGGDTTTETEDEDTSPEKPKRKKKPQTKRAPKKSKKAAANSSQSTNDSSFSDTFTSGKGKAVKKKKVNSVFERSMEEWASDLNSHFSEVEDCELVIL
ncbi:serine/arginine repetitive matrix protein 2-like [Penaeus indicus]|uniref:serine/arginine repetitive matrix protein 2-like n=1 Tax=Penaeus indicus TaxID=29960 RepID=UPI00300C3092